MPNSVKQQALEEVATQVAAMASITGVFTDTPTVRYLDWEDVYKLGGITIRYDDDEIEGEELGTNNRDAFGYKAHVIVCIKRRTVMAEEAAAITTIFQALVRKYNNRRRMDNVSDTGTSQLASRVVRGPRAPKVGEWRDKMIFAKTVILWFLEVRDAA
jgi:hypothetical protein